MLFVFTCSDTFAPSHLCLSSVDPGAVATEAETRKSHLYTDIMPLHHFAPVAVETAGPFGPSALELLRDIGRRIKTTSGDPLSTYHLLQHVSVAVQQGNAAAILGIYKQSNITLSLFD